MSTHNPQLLNRAKLAARLRSGQDIQQRGAVGIWIRPNDPVCFVGVAFRTFPACAGNTHSLCLLLDTHLGPLIDANDRGKTFPELADTLEALPYSEK